jgi:hypothetical protein
MGLIPHGFKNPRWVHFRTNDMVKNICENTTFNLIWSWQSRVHMGKAMKKKGASMVLAYPSSLVHCPLCTQNNNPHLIQQCYYVWQKYELSQKGMEPWMEPSPPCDYKPRP